MLLFGSSTLKIGGGVMVKEPCPMHTCLPASLRNGQLLSNAKFVGLRKIGISPTYR